MKLVAYNSSETGGMNGVYSLISVFYDKDGRCKVEIAHRSFHNQPTKYTNYYAEGLLEKLSEVCERYNVISWTNLPANNMFLHDAPTINDCFSFENGTKISLGSKTQYPLEAFDLFQEIKSLISESESYCVEKEVREEAPAPLAMGMMQFQTMEHK